MKPFFISLLLIFWFVGNVLGMISFYQTMGRVFRKRPILKFLTAAATLGYSLLLLLMIFRWGVLPLLRK